MATAFTRRGAAPEQVSAAEVDKLHSKIGQLVVERNFWPVPRINWSERAAKNGEQKPQAKCAPSMQTADADPI